MSEMDKQREYGARSVDVDTAIASLLGNENEQLQELLARSEQNYSAIKTGLPKIPPINAESWHIIRLFEAIRVGQIQRLSLERTLSRPRGDGWIPTSERLPEDGAMVMVFANHDSHTGCTVATYEPDLDYPWVDRIDGCSNLENDEAEVTHWQPLPPAPSSPRREDPPGDTRAPGERG